MTFPTYPNNIRQAVVDFARKHSVKDAEAIEKVVKPNGEVKAKIQNLCEKIYAELDIVPVGLKQRYVKFSIRGTLCGDIDDKEGRVAYLKDYVNAREKAEKQAITSFVEDEISAKDSLKAHHLANLILETRQEQIRLTAEGARDQIWAYATENISVGIEKINEHNTNQSRRKFN